MAIDFKYVPLSPEPISGESVLDQTQIAINELGVNIEDTAQIAQEAIDTANSANITANQSMTEAQNASASALAAQSTADTALSTAQSAQSDANTALTTANQALDASTIAEGDSETALTTANQAITTANSAQSTATTANQNSNNALSISNSALSLAEVALGVFTIEPDAVDANSKYVTAEKLFLTNTLNTNFPTDIGNPFWFMSYINSNNTSVTHTCWDDENTSKIYTRTATTNNSDPLNPVVTWSPWQSVATPNNLESVDVQVDPSGQPAGTYLVFVYSTTSGTDTLYVNLSQLMPVYTSGNGAISISTDYKISLQLDSSASNGLTVSPTGLQSVFATAATSTNSGIPGIAQYAADNNTTARNTAATPAGVASQISQRNRRVTFNEANGTARTGLTAGIYRCDIDSTTNITAPVQLPSASYIFTQMTDSTYSGATQIWNRINTHDFYFRQIDSNGIGPWITEGPFGLNNRRVTFNEANGTARTGLTAGIYRCDIDSTTNITAPVQLPSASYIFIQMADSTYSGATQIWNRINTHDFYFRQIDSNGIGPWITEGPSNVGSLKAWAYVNSDGTIISSFNVTSVTRSGDAGIYIIYSPSISNTSGIIHNTTSVNTNALPKISNELLSQRLSGRATIATFQYNTTFSYADSAFFVGII